jgi:hypothetical protein
MAELPMGMLMIFGIDMKSLQVQVFLILILGLVIPLLTILI